MTARTGAAITSAAAVTVAAVAAIVVAADGSGGSKPATPGGAERSLSGPREKRPTRAPLGIVSRTLARLDPRSLKPRGLRLHLGEYHDTWSFSPDGSRLALGMGSPSRICGAGVCIVDLASMRIIKDVEAPIAAEAVAWLRPRRVVAVLQSGEIIAADPVTGKTLRRQRLSVAPFGPPSAGAPRERLLVLLGDDPLKLVSIDAQGRPRVARLGRVRLGDASPLPPERAGLTVDPRRGHALVFAAGAPAVEVDLRTMRVRYHRLRTQPVAHAPAEELRARLRYALWLGRGLVAVFGEDVVLDRGAGVRGVKEFPAGVQLIDTETWTVRTLHRRASRARRAAGRLLVYTRSPSAQRPAGVGLRVYTSGGRRLLTHLFGNKALDVQVAGGYAYALSSRAVRIVRVRSGSVVRESGPPPSREIRILSTRLSSGYRP
jgi:hypothetical protein